MVCPPQRGTLTSSLCKGCRLTLQDPSDMTLEEQAVRRHGPQRRILASSPCIELQGYPQNQNSVNWTGRVLNATNRLLVRTAAPTNKKHRVRSKCSWQFLNVHHSHRAPACKHWAVNAHSIPNHTLPHALLACRPCAYPLAGAILCMDARPRTGGRSSALNRLHIACFFHTHLAVTVAKTPASTLPPPSSPHLQYKDGPGQLTSPSPSPLPCRHMSSPL
eukprot:1161634-Pelagomonas_calceolata.AAC.6